MTVDEAIATLENLKAKLGGDSELCQGKRGFLYEVLDVISAPAPQKVAIVVIDEVPGRYMANIFAFRATNPKEMKAQLDPVGPANDAWLCSLAVTPACGLIVAAWGKDGNHHNRAYNVWRLLHGYSDNLMVALPPIKCMGVLQDGNPHHPLYMDATTSLSDYELPLQVDEKKA